MKNIYRNQTRHNVQGRLDLLMAFDVGASGAVTANTEVGGFFAVAKSGTGEYTLTIDETWIKTARCAGRISGAVGNVVSCGRPTIGASSTTLVVTVCVAGTPTNVENQTIEVDIVAMTSAAGDR